MADKFWHNKLCYPWHRDFSSWLPLQPFEQQETEVYFIFVLLQSSFSNGGHLFAAVHGNVIQLYSSTTFENVGNLKGHNGKVS